VALMGLFTIGNIMSALAPGYGVLLAARIVTSLCHGSFFGIGSVVAGKLAGRGRQAGAVAAMFSGLTIANIGGVPLAAWVGQHIGWRMAFAGIGLFGLMAMAALQFALPSLPSDGEIDVRRELAVLRRGPVILALTTTALGSSAMFTVFTYIAPILQGVTHVSSNVVTVTLVIYGVGLTLGNWLGGKFADKALTTTLMVVLAALAGLLILFALTMRWPVPAIATVFAWGVATFALVPALQSRVMSVAGDAPNLASSINIGAFNLGNAVGAAIGGGIIALGLAYPWVSLAGAGAAIGGLILVALSLRPGASRAAS
jgi:DHA1 family inner membrane transport protein